jgi:hypothetical protein
MRDEAESVNSAGFPHPVPENTASEIRLALEQILASPEFRGSKRCRNFLRYIVEAALGGRGPELKERTLAVELYGLPSNADLEKYSTVRVCANHVRLRLGRYYASASGAESPWRIELQPGSYAPQFRRLSQPPPAAKTHGSRRRWVKWQLVAAGLALAGAAAAGLSRLLIPPAGLPERFWAPAFRSGKVVIVLAELPSDPAWKGRGAALQASAAAELLHYFRNRNSGVRIRSVTEFIAASHSDSFVILGPAFPAHVWMKAPVLRACGFSESVFQLFSPQRSGNPDSTPASADFAAIYRVRSLPEGPFCVLAAGSSPDAMWSAARLMTDPAMLERFLKQAGHVWNGHNALAALAVFPRGGEQGFTLLSARPWQPVSPAP